MVDTLIAIVEFILALSILAGLHEAGHFLAARLFNIEVEEFGLGLPPRAKKLFTWKGTEFTLNWIPFGAFVRPKGENDPEIVGGMGAAHPLKRLVVLLGGPVTNLVVGIILFVILFMQIGSPDASRVLIGGTVANSPAAGVGLQAGDLILKINDTAVTSTEQMSALVAANKGTEITITLDRAGQVSQVKAIPRISPPPGEGALGVSLTNPVVPTTLDKSVPLAFSMIGQYAEAMILLPGRLIQGTISPDQGRIVGPKGMFDMFAQARTRDLETPAVTTPTTRQLPAVNVLNLLASISVALGLTNLLPIPALDGGRILFLLPEFILRKRVPAKYENMIHAVGFFALLTLIAVVTFQDIINPIVLP
jgi:regulator of sigma E protease